ncbi:chemotaxis protein CheW [Methylocaldum sp.]|uniref:chemotaxis protein CheW n=1 Tax=Methylocaldum sp. TaxID=1969727 RepID=UPI002D4ABEAF|nr:chemotaxis protein CheW [Methylocaldum sp.]HYE36756.1 chemotaxis protein CheW [Methylocaldum sp.]
MANLIATQKSLPQAVQDVDSAQQYLSFQLSGELFALDILHVKEILEYGQITPVPMTPVFIRGVINLRGAVVPVIDLSARFGRAPIEVTRRSCIIIVEVQNDGERHDIGVTVDAVNEVVELPPAEIEPAPAFGAKLRTEFITGMGKLNGRFVILLDLAKVLSMDEMALLAEMGHADHEAEE